MKTDALFAVVVPRPLPRGLVCFRCWPRRVFFIVMLGMALNASAKEEEQASPINSLDQSALQETFRLLRQNYIQRDQLTLEDLNRAALAGLLERLDFGAELVERDTTNAPAAETAAPIHEKLTDTIAYLRPRSFAAETLPAFDAALAALRGEKNITLILDLRTPAPPADFSVAAQMLSRFVPAGQPLFTVQKPDDPAPRRFQSTEAPLWTGPLALLIDDECNNAAETVAAVLLRALKPPVFGSATLGRTMEYQATPISATHALRFASAEMRLPDGTSLFRKGLTPTLAAPRDAEAKGKIFTAHAEEGVKKFITNPERPRHNERALVENTAPELPYQIAKAAGETTEYDQPPLQDRVLQTAVDVLMAREFLK